MGTWSITPNNGLASIDANSGVATFREHTSDVTYTIHFSDSTCTGGEVTKTFMVFACSQPTCVCSTFSAATSGTRVPSTTSSTEYIVGRYTAATNCSDSISISARAGTDFLTGLRASGGNIYAKVAVANTGSERSSTYFVRQGSCEDYFTAYQSSGGTPPTPTPCTCTATPVTTKLPSTITTSVNVGSYERSGDCSGAYSASFVTGSGTDFLGSFNFSSGVITANVTSANPTTSTRSGTYRIYKGDTLCSSNFTVTQAANSPTPTVCSCSSSNFSVTGVNVDASGGNAVLIANFTSECEPSLSFENYAGETFIDYSITSSTYDSSTKKGKIYAKVQQNTAYSDRMEQVGVYINDETNFCKHFAVTQAKGICTPELTVSAAGNCCVNFKVVQPCSDIQQYDIIEWGYSKFNSPIFTNGQAFSSKSATGATGISQCPSITSDGDWYIFWRNRTAHSVSGSQIVSLTGCAISTQYDISLKVPEKYIRQGNTFIILGPTSLTPAQIAKQTTGNAIAIGPGGIAKIGYKDVNASCNYNSYTFNASYNVPNDTNWTVGSLAITDQYNVVNIDGNTVTTIGSFTMQNTDFKTCSDTIYDIS